MTQFLIHSLGVRGDGIADGPLFAPLTLPGETIVGEVEGDQITNVKIVTPSGERVSAPCRHFKSCGGCSLQHAHDEFVARWKVSVVQEALKTRGLETDFRPIATSPPKSRRRATFAAKRTKSGAQVGFFARGSGTIIAIPECQILVPALVEAQAAAEQLARVGGSRKTPLAVTVTQSEQGLDVLVRHGKPLDGPFRQQLAQICQSLGLARLTWDDEVIAMAASPEQIFGKARVVPPPGAFLQATKDGEMALLSGVREIVAGASRVADLFAGCGTFSLPLAEDAEVLAIEGDPAMIDALDAGWRRTPGLKRVTSEARDLFRRPMTPDELRGFDAVVVDPPRAGAEAQIAELAQSAVPRIAHVSCNPVTFARDAKALTEAGYDLRWARIVDQFRWSSHIELVACFERS